MTVFPLSHYPPGLIWVSSQVVQNEKRLQLSSLWKSLLRILSVGRNVWYLKIKYVSGEKHLIPPWGKIWIQDCILLPEKTNLQWDTLNRTQVVQMHTVAFASCAWHTHCTQVGKDRSITVRRRKYAVSCIPCPSAKKKKIIWIKLMREYSSLSTALLCWQNEISKALGIKIHCNTHTERTPRKLCSIVEKKNRVMQHTEPGNFSSLFNYVLETLAQGAEREWELFCAHLLSCSMGCMSHFLCTQNYKI